MVTNLLQQMQEMQRRAEEFQKTLGAMEVEGVAGGGLVRVTLNGLGELKKLSIDPSLMNPGEHHVVADLVVAACAGARSKLETAKLQDSGFVQDLLKNFTSGFSGTD